MIFVLDRGRLVEQGMHQQLLVHERLSGTLDRTSTPLGDVFKITK